MRKIAHSLFFLFTACILALLPTAASLQQGNGGGVLVFTIDGAIGPAISAYIQQGIAQAEADNDYLVVLQMDTPGGLDTAMRDIIQSILDANLPIVTYVYPQGARAASAGTYILYASHIAAMAPATNLGAATPVQIGASEPDGQDSNADQPDSASAMERKVVNDARAYIRSLAERNGRNALWAESAVSEAASLSANEALAEGVINIVATDLNDLLAQLQGREVSIHGTSLTLDMTGKTVRYAEMDWRTNLLTVLTNPSLILILGMIGIYGLLIEFYSPGFGLGGIVGMICLLIAGYGLQLLPINYAGLGLIILGIGLMIGEAFVPSFGMLGAGGIIAFTVGGVMLVDTDLDVFRVSLPMLVAIAVFSAILLAITLRMFMRLRHSRLVSGLQTFVGRSGESMENFAREGMVKVQGEIWQARTDTPLLQGDAVKVVQVDMDGLHLLVTKA
jgi:membrane-bound serine protease (ClpP class)